MVARRKAKSHDAGVESVNQGSELSDANPSGPLSTWASGLGGSEENGSDNSNQSTIISINNTLAPPEEVYPGGLGAVGVEEWVEVLFTMDSGAMITAMYKE